MLRGIYTAYTGMVAQQEKMDTVSNNLANANTTGYKQDNVLFESFDKVLAVKINDPEKISNKTVGTMTLGSKVAGVFTDFAQGSLNLTEDPLNIAVEGEGMITVGKLKNDGTYTEYYTRDGSLTIDQDGMLATKNGYYVLGNDGAITVPNGQMSIGSNGNIYVNDEYVDTIQVTDFEDMSALKKHGDNLFEKTDRTEKKAFAGDVRQGYIEGSNVNSVKELIEMMSLQRVFEANQKVLTTYDSTLENVVSNVGRV